MSDWISVDQKPEIGQVVFLNYITMGDGANQQYVGRWTGDYWYVIGYAGSLSQKGFSHWMKIELPK